MGTGIKPDTLEWEQMRLDVFAERERDRKSQQLYITAGGNKYGLRIVIGQPEYIDDATSILPGWVHQFGMTAEVHVDVGFVDTKVLVSMTAIGAHGIVTARWRSDAYARACAIAETVEILIAQGRTLKEITKSFHGEWRDR